MGILENYKRIRDDIDHAAVSCGRNPDEIKIMCVTKTFSAPVVQEAIDSGIMFFGENKVQEAKSKIPELRGDFSFHMIGHLQSNKARDAVKIFDVIHSIDSENTARRVSEEAAKIQKVQKILLQVNTSGEGTKSGAPPEEMLTLFGKIHDLENIRILGIMAIAPFTADVGLIRRSFHEAKKVLEQIAERYNIPLRELSMGMSSDYRIAIEEGSTIVRIGTAVFGERIFA